MRQRSELQNPSFSIKNPLVYNTKFLIFDSPSSVIRPGTSKSYEIHHFFNRTLMENPSFFNRISIENYRFSTETQ